MRWKTLKQLVLLMHLFISDSKYKKSSLVSLMNYYVKDIIFIKTTNSLSVSLRKAEKRLSDLNYQETRLLQTTDKRRAHNGQEHTSLFPSSFSSALLEKQNHVVWTFPSKCVSKSVTFVRQIYGLAMA